jgi:uncharacterized damage-inducible protein DinB
MTTANIDNALSFPIGKYQSPATFSPETRRAAIETLRHLPSALVEATAGLSQAQLQEPYREGGWTLRQVVHHVADSHMNAYSRVRLALTEDWPTIKPYDQDSWANLVDAKTLPVDVSLTLLDALHTRWVALFESLTEPDWERGYIHPESGRRQTIEQVLTIYAWHSHHHTAHIVNLRQRKGW